MAGDRGWHLSLLFLTAIVVSCVGQVEEGTIKFKDASGNEADPESMERPPIHDCEVCFILAEELVLALEETAKVKEVLKMGNRLDANGNWVVGKRVLFANVRHAR